MKQSENNVEGVVTVAVLFKLLLFKLLLFKLLLFKLLLFKLLWCIIQITMVCEILLFKLLGTVRFHYSNYQVT